MSAGTATATSNGPFRHGALVRHRAIDDIISSDPTGTGARGPESPMRTAWIRLRENRFALVSFTTFMMIFVLCIGSGWFAGNWAGRTASEQNINGRVGSGDKAKEVVNKTGIPSVGPGFRREYTMGSDALGRDVFMRVLEGGKVSLTIGLGSAVITLVLGTLIGTAAGFYGGRVDMIASRVIDVMLAFPAIVFAITLSTALATGDGFWFIKRGSISLPLLVIGVGGCFYFARIVRAKALELAAREFVEAARALGASNKRIMARHMVPHLSTLIITYSGIIVSANIIAEAGLSFLGVGVLPPIPSWGNMIADGRIFYSTAWWIAFFPGLMIMLTVLSLNLFGEAVEEAFDPKGSR